MLSVSFIGFQTFENGVELTAGQSVRLDAVLQVEGQSASVLVTAERPRGEVEQINRERTADNIVQAAPQQSHD